MEKRRLSAIMFTDIVGYTRKMGEDKVKMLELLKDHSQMVETAAENHDGEIVKRMSDGYFISFNSALNAVLSAIEIQQAFCEYNKEKPQADQVLIRIGIHFGDIVISEGDVFGDGVNVASGIEPLVHPGGICVTRSVYDIVKKKMTVKAVELGLQQLKNVDEAVEVFHLLSETVGIKELRKNGQLKRRRRGVILYPIIGVFLLLISLVLWHQGVFQPGGINEIIHLLKNVEIPEDRLAVLPLRNLTGQEEDEYYCVGFAQDLIYRFSPVKELYVYPIENVLALDESVWTFNGIKENLGAKYIIQGSLNRTGNNLTINIEILETVSGKRLFSEKYEFRENEKPKMLERISKDLLFQIAGRGPEGIQGYWTALTSRNPIATDIYHQAMHINRDYPIDGNEFRKDMADSLMIFLEMALDEDSSFLPAKLHLARAYAFYSGRSRRIWYDDSTRNVFREKADKLIADILEQDYESPDAYNYIANCYILSEEYDRAEILLRQAFKISPNNPLTLELLSMVYFERKQYIKARAMIFRALNIYREFGDKFNEFKLYYLIANGYRILEYPDFIFAYNDSALSALEEVNLQRNIKLLHLAMVHNLYGMDLAKYGKYQEALEHYEKELELRKQSIEGITIPKSREDNYFVSFVVIYATYSRLGKVYEYLGEYSLSQNTFRNAIIWADSIKCSMVYRIIKLVSFNNLIKSIIRIGDLDKAKECIAKMMEFINESDEHEAFRPDLLINKASLSILRDDREGARNYLIQALNLVNNENPRTGEILCELGMLDYLDEQYTTASDTLNKVISNAKTRSKDSLRASFYIGAIEIKQDEVESGLARMNKALDSMKVYAHKVEAHRILGEIMIDLGRKEEARQHLEEGRKMAEKSGMKGEIKRYEELLGGLKGI
ncbi:MAG: hypothetical protein HQ568_10225 [Calditrichaeota bacterium]|nr:hypothetical protein [Calditrichota bacterium]